jgi:hypothetical protein
LTGHRTATADFSAPAAAAAAVLPPQAYTLHTLRQRDDVEVVGLLTTFNGQAERVAMHAVRLQLLRMQAAAVGLPVHEVRLVCCGWH